MSDKDIVNQSSGAVVKPSKKRRCAAHCKRFWWAHAIIFVCVVVLVVCLVIFVGVPNIAQDKMDDAKLEIQGVEILETEPENYLMKVDSTITTDGSIHADIDPFVGNMYLADVEPRVAFATLDFPATTADKHQVVNISQEVKITNMEAFTQFNIWFTNNETVNMAIEGETKAQPRGLSRKYKVDFKKKLEVKALNLFKGTEVNAKTAKLSTKLDKNGKNFYGQADIPNASHFTLDIGNVSFINFIDGEKIGTLWIDNLLLHPGSNVVDISAKMDQAPVLKAAQSEKYCKTGKVPFNLLGDTVTNHGKDLTYFAAALGSANQTVEIDIATIIYNNIGFDPRCTKDKKDD